MTKQQILQKAKEGGFEFVYLSKEWLTFLKGAGASLAQMKAYAGGTLGEPFAESVIDDGLRKGLPIQWVERR